MLFADNNKETNINTISIIISSLEGLIYYVNPLTCDILGYEEKELINKHVGVIIKDCAKSNTFAGIKLKDLTDKKAVSNIKKAYIAKNGAEIPVILSISIIKKNEDILGIIFETQDINASKKAAQGLKLDFISNISREIRTPITGIIGMTDLLLKTNLSSQQIEYLTLLQNSAETLMPLVKDMLDFVEIEEGRFELDSYHFSLRESVGSLINSINIIARKKNLELFSSIAPEVPDRLIGDGARLWRILFNFLTHAIRFTDKGRVVLSIKNVIPPSTDLQSSILINEEKIDAKENTSLYESFESWHSALSFLISDWALQFSISDTGISIPTGKRESIFKPLLQADSSFSQKYGGLGLGLAASSKLIELMGGRLWLKSNDEKGDTFNFTAQFSLPPECEAALINSFDIKDLRVLILDNNDKHRLMLTEMLANYGIASNFATTGSAAIEEMFQAVSINSPYRILILNAHIPDMNIADLISQIKKSLIFNKTAIILLSSTDSYLDYERFKRLGISDYLQKPVKRSDLLNKLIQFSTKVFSLNNDYANQEEQLVDSYKNLRILLVEDDAINQYLAVSFLKDKGHNIKLVNNGKEAIEAIEKAAYDLILMDVEMPIMDGLQTTKAIREKEMLTNNKHMPIIAMTALALKGDRQRCLDAGMDEYISKPIDRDELLKTIDNVMKSYPPVSIEPSAEVIDIPLALSRLQGNKKLLKEIAVMFLKELPNYLSAIEEALQQGDSYKLERAGHTLKSAVGNFAAKSAFETVHAVEMAGKNGDMTGAKTAIAELIKQIDKLKPALEKIAKNDLPS